MFRGGDDSEMAFEVAAMCDRAVPPKAVFHWLQDSKRPVMIKGAKGTYSKILVGFHPIVSTMDIDCGIG